MSSENNSTKRATTISVTDSRKAVRQRTNCDHTDQSVSSISNGTYISSELTCNSEQPQQRSLVDDMVFVVEIYEDKTKQAVLLMETSDTQFYDVKGSDRNPHFHILGTYQMGRFLSDLNFGRKGGDRFVEIYDDVHPIRPLPKYYYIVLKRNQDYNLRYATVRNNIHNNNAMKLILTKIPLQYMADRMFLSDDGNARKRGKDDDGSRGNKLWNIGFTGRDTTNGKTEPGMNIPNRMTAMSKEKGRGSDETLEHVIARAGCALHELSKVVQKGMGENLPMNEDQFADRDWHEMFTKRWGNSLGLSESESKNLVFTGCSVFGTGETTDYSIVKTDKHTDPGNSSKIGHDHSVTVVAIVTVRPKDAPPFKVRMGMNIYDKHDCELAVEKKKVNVKLGNMLAMWRHGNPNRFGELSSYLGEYYRFKPPERLDSGIDYWIEDASADKDAYYSFFVNEIKHLGSENGNDRRLLVEALLTICMTPCPVRWREGVRAAGKILKKTKAGTGEYPNFIVLYCHVRKTQSGSISGGGKANRCQPSFQGIVSIGQLLRSAAHLDDQLEHANQTNNTKALLRRMTDNNKHKIVGLGHFWAQGIINIATKINLITNTIHALSPVVSHTTATFRRMKDLGVTTRQHAESVVPWVSSYLKWNNEVLVENGFCEMLRDAEGITKKDVFAIGHVLYRIVNNTVIGIKNDGTVLEVESQVPESTGAYTPSGKWWEDSFRKAMAHNLSVDDKWLKLSADCDE